MLRRLKNLGESERGDSAVMAVLIMVALLAVLALVVDGGGKVAADEEASNIAQSAAREGVNAGTGPSVGSVARINQPQAVAAARSYLQRAGATGTVSSTATSITVTATVGYTPKLLPVGQMNGHGTSTAEAHRN